MKSRRLIVVLLPLLSAACGRPAPEAHSPAPSPAPATAAARAYRDPNTGAFGEPPPGAAPAPAPAAARPALVEEPAPGGGRMLRLRGAFHSEFVANTDGKTTTASCVAKADAPCTAADGAP